LGAFEHVEVVGLVLELQVGLHNEPKEDIKEANVIDKKGKAKVELPGKILVIKPKTLKIARPGFSGDQLVHQCDRFADIVKVLLR
jgi:hypothetical protein